jgi:hypothetical protein
MNMNTTRLVILAATLLAAPPAARCTTFTLDDAPLHTPLPVGLTVDGITATFSATGQGFSIQEAGVLGFTPAGFSGYCIYPSSVYSADLLVGFSRALADFSILYAPEEYACDSSARMRVTAYMDGALVGTSTATADPPGTWPTATLAFSSSQGFNQVVIHYDAAPPTGGDWGPIFMADNMVVTGMAAGSLQLPGDVNGDKALDISDPVALLGFLFSGSPKSLPCGDGSAGQPGNISLIDWQPDGAVDISDAVAMLDYLFLGGRAHTLAVPGAETTSCVPIAGCPDICGR